ncbi:MAG: formate dehydrogenase accessory sulfurtransferase FdhD, partial [Ruminiclostridium sp.]|nr:formate dehydrogenase accessory sulfurtransferase FdhD [Ruminiclostridium sp.]
MSDLIERRDIISVTPGGRREKCEKPLLKEHSLAIDVDGKRLFSIVCTAEHLKELTVGRLFTEGIIGSAEDIAGISFDEGGNTADVILARSVCGGRELRPLPPAKWSAEVIVALA